MSNDAMAAKLDLILERLTELTRELEYLRIEREGIRDEEQLAERIDAAAPGEAAEDFWDDGWPID